MKTVPIFALSFVLIACGTSQSYNYLGFDAYYADGAAGPNGSQGAYVTVSYSTAANQITIQEVKGISGALNCNIYQVSVDSNTKQSLNDALNDLAENKPLENYQSASGADPALTDGQSIAIVFTTQKGGSPLTTKNLSYVNTTDFAKLPPSLVSIVNFSISSTSLIPKGI